MPNAAEAVLQDHEGRAVLRFERMLPHPPERVWRALTDAGDLSRWHPTPPEFEPVTGGAVTFGSDERSPEMPDGEVTEYDPPRVLGHTWGDDHLRWDIRPREDGSLLILTHTFDDRFKAARDAAGWHLCLDALSSLLDGASTPPAGETADELPPGWPELNRAYEQRFGIPSDKATPPPGR
jgi:uncharacterized protein YndB with AHSA1/START domain